MQRFFRIAITIPASKLSLLTDLLAAEGTDLSITEVAGDTKRTVTRVTSTNGIREKGMKERANATTSSDARELVGVEFAAGRNGLHVGEQCAHMTTKGYIVTTIDPNGNVSVEGPFDRKPDWRELQKRVGGLIESVPHFNRYGGRFCEAWINECGRIDGLPYNPKASDVWKELLGYSAETKSRFRYEPLLFGPLVIVQTALSNPASNTERTMP